MKLKSKVALITGAASGIGAATALRFAEEGANLIINDINKELANKVADNVKAYGVDAIICIADVCKKSEVESMFTTALEHFETLHILVNNAGINRDALAKKMSETDWDAVININLKGTFLCAQAALGPMMKQQWGRIINTASVGALGNIGQANYSASKSGVIGLTKTLALECAKYNITVNCVSPGATNTPMLTKLPQEFAEKLRSMIPLKRFADPREIANLHLFLASEEASYITGQIIFIDGGLSVGF
jgi:3-oxoacyl-[acyl-carrier protein] reductase